MQISRAARYAVYATIEIARRQQTDPEVRVLCADLCAPLELPREYLAKLLTELSRHGVLTSVRGANGGYRLARPPERITLAEVMKAVGEPGLERPDDFVGDARTRRRLASVFNGATQSWQRRLTRTSLADLVPVNRR